MPITARSDGQLGGIGGGVGELEPFMLDNHLGRSICIVGNLEPKNQARKHLSTPSPIFSSVRERKREQTEERGLKDKEGEEKKLKGQNTKQ